MEKENAITEAVQVRYYRFGEFELDLKNESLFRAGEKANLPHRTYQVLRLLVENCGEVVSKQQFFERIWDGSFVEENNLTVAITAIRKALGDNAKEAKYIENLPRKGYRFIADVQSVTEADQAEQNGHRANSRFEKSPSAEPEAQEPSETRNGGAGFFEEIRHRKIAVGIVAAILIVAFVTASVSYESIFPSSAQKAGRIDSLAVLPFENKTEATEYLTEGLTQSVIQNLSQYPGLRIIDRNSVVQYKLRPADMSSIGRELNVQAVVSGSVEQQGDVLIISAEMFETASGNSLWRQQLRRRASDIFAVQQEISQAIVQSIKIDVAGASLRRQTNDPEAYDLYLKGRYYWNKRTDPDFLKAVEYFKAAIDRDPTFAMAYVGLAEAYTLGDFEPLGYSLEEKNAMIRRAIQTALEIDETLGEAYTVLAVNKCFYDWDLAGAERDYRRAIELNPNHATAHHWYAEFLAMQGRFDESFALYERALSLDPLSLPIRTDMAHSHFYARDPDKAIELLNKTRELHPEYVRTYEFLYYVYREKEMFTEAADSIDKAVSLRFQRGEYTQARFERHKKYVANLIAESKANGPEGFWRTTLANSEGIGPFLTAAIYSKLGETENAFTSLEKAFNGRHSGMVWLKSLPELDPIRSDPRYHDLLRRVGFTSN